MSVLRCVLLYSGGIWGKFYGSVVFCGSAVDENVFFAVKQVVVGDEPFLLVEQRPDECHIVDVASVGAVQKCMREVLHGIDEVVEEQEMAVRAFLFGESVVS